MLRELRIENLLLIERAELRFSAGLNAITGETGAGKTVLAHSLDLLLGGKPRSGIVRPGADEAWVEGAFELPEEIAGEPDLAEIIERLPDSNEVVLARRVSAAGRSSAYIGGRAASAADLKALGSRLLSFYGQHEHRKLTLRSFQADVLDDFAGPQQLELRERYRAAHSEVTAAVRELAQLREREGARERDLDLLRFELAEIDELAPDPDEHEQLIAERDRLGSVETLRSAAAEAYGAISGGPEDEGGASSALGVSEAALARAAGSDPELEALAGRVTAAAVELGDLAAELRDYLDGLEADPERLEQLAGRIDAIERLARKHGGTVGHVLAHAEWCRGEIERLDSMNERFDSLEAEIERLTARRAELAAELTAGRQVAAPRLEAAVAEALAELAMDGASLEVELVPVEGGFSAAGAEAVELRVATNPGMPLAPLGESASGGELSRVMLALSDLGSASGATTLVFDEIDAGIGGKVARRVGERLRALGSSRQVVCITHLAQVASLAESHFRVEKSALEGTARATVEQVEGSELVSEIVRMLGAEEHDQSAVGHARELLAA